MVFFLYYVKQFTVLMSILMHIIYLYNIFFTCIDGTVTGNKGFVPKCWLNKVCGHFTFPSHKVQVNHHSSQMHKNAKRNIFKNTHFE